MMIRALVAVAILSASDASAHGLNLFVRDEGSSVKGNAYFTGGDPARNIVIKVMDEAGTEFGETTTGSDGNFTYSGRRPTGLSIFVASTPDGHRAETQLESSGPGADAPRLVASAVSVKSHEAQLTELHAAIDRLEHRLWVRDIIGGIGYIFGLAGFWALWRARQGHGHG